MRHIFPSVTACLLTRLPVRFVRKHLRNTTTRVNAQGRAARQRQLLVDVSVIIKSDSHTGIQRVVRALLNELLMQPPVGYQVRPVFADRKHGYHYAPQNFGREDLEPARLNQTTPVCIGPGDIFLGLDLAAHLLWRHSPELGRWRRAGVQIHVLVYDLLPVLYPKWFTGKTTRHFQKWLRVVAFLADNCICISETVRGELTTWMHNQYRLAPGSIATTTISLGADIMSTRPSSGFRINNLANLVKSMESRPSVLMIGTLEPRKGHEQVLDAFDQLWQKGADVSLIIVGKAGWKTDALQMRLGKSLAIQPNLYWFDDASDEFLELLYRSCFGVIVASEAEGYGLPLVEALYYNKPVLARSISVFHEIGGNAVTFFTEGDRENLAHSIEAWLRNPEAAAVRARPGIHQTWHGSAQALLERMSLSRAGHVV